VVKAKSLLIDTAIVFIGTALNFFVFLEAYKRLAFPYIHEEQRVDNAPYIFIYVLPSFFVISLILLVLYKMLANRYNKNC
jgi:uncharacterized BrkB/YihY/UPF0761 family membrane protein